MRKVLGILTGVLIFAAAGQAKEITVCPAAGEGCDYTSIQEAVNNAKDSDVIKVKAGLYKEYNIGVTKCVSIVGEGPNETIIDAQRSGNGFDITWKGAKSCEMKISSLMVRNGLADNGGGIYVYSNLNTNDYHFRLLLDNVKLINNIANKKGGGAYIYFEGGSNKIEITNSTIYKNQSADLGGGIYAYGYNSYSELKIENSNIEKNFSKSDGGGISTDNRLKLKVFSSIIKDNKANDWGGGLAVCDETTVDKSWIVGNKAGKGGGGIHSYTNCNLSMNLSSSIIAFNEASEKGGGIYFGNENNCCVKKVLNVLGSTFSNNTAPSGQGIYMESTHASSDLTVSVQDSVFADGNNEIDFNLVESKTYSIDFENNYFLKKPNFPENITFSDDVVKNNYEIKNAGFVAPEEFDFSLKADSPLINKGVNLGYTEDITGKNRGEVGDIGACEYPDVCKLGSMESVEAPSGGSENGTQFKSVTASVNFENGWNLAGIPTFEKKSIKDIFGDSLNSVYTLWKWDRKSGKWELYTSDEKIKNYIESFPVSIELLDESSTINPGEGFWVKASSPFTLEFKGYEKVER